MKVKRITRKGIVLSTKLGKCASVVLSEGQAEYASEIGRQRTAAAKNEKHRDGVREPRSWDEREKYDIMAAKGEMCAHLLTGLPWTRAVGKRPKNEGDLATGTKFQSEIRTEGKHGKRLRLAKWDYRSQWFIHVTVDDWREYRVWGCIWGQKAWEVGRWQEYGTSGRHWMFVDKKHLMPITHLTDEYDKDIDNWAQELADLPKT